MKDLNRHIYEFDEIVIGSCLEAVSYSYLSGMPLILNGDKKPYFFEFFEKDSCLEKYLIKSTEYVLESSKGPRPVGVSRLEVWERLVFCLSMSGLIPAADKVFSIRVEDDNLLKITTKGSRVIRFKFKKLRIFDSDNVLGLIASREPEKFKVVDWVNVRSGMTHQYDHLETGDEFIKEIYFHPSERLGAGENDNRKDLVAISYLTREQLDDFEYSDTYAKFKITNLMKETGIKGARNGRRHDDPNKYAYYSIKIEPYLREVRVSEKHFFTNTECLIFDYREEREIYSDLGGLEGYTKKFSEAVND